MASGGGTVRPPSLRELVEDYLATRRSLGFDLTAQAWWLRDLVRHAERIGHHGALTQELAVGWALASRSADPAAPARRLSAVRRLARYGGLVDPATEIPPAGQLGRVPHRRRVHVYSDAELGALFGQTRLLSPREGLRPTTYLTLFALLASSGLRLSEACRLERGDVDLDRGVITVRAGKFRKARLVPLHPTATLALARYGAERDRRCGGEGRFLRTERSPALATPAVEKTFSRIRERLGWTAHGRAVRPRIHDLRHTFAVRRLLTWYREGADLERGLLALSTYLGHARPSDTYWYLTGVPELMAIAAARFERYALQAREGGS
jgi:integrase